MEGSGIIKCNHSMRALAFMAAPGCIVVYLMLLTPLAALGQNYISHNIPVRRCRLIPSA